MFDNIYKSKTTPITSHTGFTGSWLTIWLKELRANVVGYSLALPREPSNFEATKLPEEIFQVRDIGCTPGKT